MFHNQTPASMSTNSRRYRGSSLHLKKSHKLTKWRKQGSAVVSTVTFYAVAVVLLSIETSASSLPFIPQREIDDNCVDNDICLTPGCVNAASAVLKNMDPNVSPCDDFYQFACGGFINATVLPIDELYQSDEQDVLQKKLKQQLRIIFSAKPVANETRHVRLVKIFYDSCINRTTIERAGVAPLQNVLKKLGGWPVLEGDAWTDKDFNWIKKSSEFRNVGYTKNGILEITVENDWENYSRNVIRVKRPELTASHYQPFHGEYETIMTRNLNYYHKMVNIAVHLGADRDRAEKELNESLHFEINLANISMSSEQRWFDMSIFTDNDTQTTLGKLSKNYPSIAWKEWLTAIFPSTTVFTDNEPIILSEPSYITDLQNLIATTPKRVVANYMFWRAVYESAEYLDEKMRRMTKNVVPVYKKCVNSAEYVDEEMHCITKNIVPLWEKCVNIVSDNFVLSTASLFIKKHFNENAKTFVSEISANIKAEFVKMFHAVDWIDNTAKNSALEKLNMMRSVIAYPDELLNDTKLNEFYQTIELTKGNFFENYLNVSLFNTLRSYSSLRIPLDRYHWTQVDRGETMSAIYNRVQNFIYAPVGYLIQRSVFSVDRPNYMNYGSIGFAIGHEISHAFGIFETMIDKAGNFIDWLDSVSEANLIKRFHCLIEQANNYTIASIGKNINGKLTLNENYADNGGISRAYLAYRAWVAANKQEKRLPGLPYTSLQMFWISMANMWCMAITREYMEQVVALHDHAPSEFRVNVPLSNSAEFSKDFNCPLGSKMNPINKCVLW